MGHISSDLRVLVLYCKSFHGRLAPRARIEKSGVRNEQRAPQSSCAIQDITIEDIKCETWCFNLGG